VGKMKRKCDVRELGSCRVEAKKKTDVVITREGARNGTSSNTRRHRNVSGCYKVGGGTKRTKDLKRKKIHKKRTGRWFQPKNNGDKENLKEGSRSHQRGVADLSWLQSKKGWGTRRPNYFFFKEKGTDEGQRFEKNAQYAEKRAPTAYPVRSRFRLYPT